MKSFDDLLGLFLLGFLSFFLGVIIVGQFIENLVILLLAGAITSGIMVLDLTKTFFLVKVRQFILIVGFCTLFFTIGYGAYKYASVLPNADATVYFEMAKGQPQVKIFIIFIANIVFWLQVRHYRIWKKNNS